MTTISPAMQHLKEEHRKILSKGHKFMGVIENLAHWNGITSFAHNKMCILNMPKVYKFSRVSHYRYFDIQKTVHSDGSYIRSGHTALYDDADRHFVDKESNRSFIGKFTRPYVRAFVYNASKVIHTDGFEEYNERYIVLAHLYTIYAKGNSLSVHDYGSAFVKEHVYVRHTHRDEWTSVWAHQNHSIIAAYHRRIPDLVDGCP